MQFFKQSGFSALQLIIVVALLVIAGWIGWMGYGYFSDGKKEMEKSDRMVNPDSQYKTDQVTASPTNNQQLANPASVNCSQKGGTLSIQSLPNGSQYGVCSFEDDQMCEEWALYRGDCPVGGVKVAGYDNQAQIYCVITGGKTLAVENATCTFPNGSKCPVETYYNGDCSPKETN